MHHFFVTPDHIFGEKITITGTDVNHIRNVLRMKTGDQISVYDGAYKEYICEIASIGEELVEASVLEILEQKNELASKLVLFQGLPKGDKMELIIQKAVELGAYEIVPVRMKRCVVKLDDKKSEAKVKRWNAIAESAAKQSGRGIIPQVSNVMSLKEAFAYSKELDVALIPYELAENMEETKLLLGTLKPGQSVGIFIGPEGGFDETEIALAKEQGVQPISLGKRILRTETAGLCILSVLMFQLEE